jgi:hypothetical protein
VRDGDRSAGLDLLLEDRDGAAAAAEHVAEAHRHERLAGVRVATASSTMSSAMRFDAPITDEGLTALSVEMLTKWETPCFSASRTRLRLPMMLLNTASSGFSSMSGTCLWAAVWNTTSGR